MTSSFKERFLAQKLEKQNEQIKNFERPAYNFHDNFSKQISTHTSNDNIGRVYHVPGGARLHSVTTVLGATKSQESKDALAAWRKRVGEEEAQRITEEAAKRGSIMHDMCEQFILGQNFEMPEPGTNAFALFRQIYPLLCRIDNVHNLEGVLYSARLGMAGRVDCVAEFDGVLSIIDFKTATKVREDYMLQDYYCQETAYAVMFAELYQTKIKQIVTLMALDGSTQKEGHVFIKKPSDYLEQLVKRCHEFRLTHSTK